ncbi:MAG: NAD(P)-dependent oxidoreductase [Caloramator sp.]|nr:NAD(P)-dependent oxidoreductase [Caloramator sp.]
MYKDNRKNNKGIRYFGVSLIPQKIRIGIIGGGRAGLIKTKSFLKKGAKVYVLSKEFLNEFYSLKGDNLHLIRGEYTSNFILDKHIVVIALDGSIKENIIRDCEQNSKLYISCSNFLNGNMVSPVNVGSKNISLSLNTNLGNPKAAVFLAQKVKKLLEEYDDFIEYTSNLRTQLNGRIKADLMDFVNSDDFYYFYKKGYSEVVLKLFLEGKYD